MAKSKYNTNSKVKEDISFDRLKMICKKFPNNLLLGEHIRMLVTNNNDK